MKHAHSVRSSQDLGMLIAAARRSRGVSQRELAAELGVTQAWISRVERGQQKAWIGQVFRLATHLGIHLQATLPGAERVATVFAEHLAAGHRRASGSPYDRRKQH